MDLTSLALNLLGAFLPITAIAAFATPLVGKLGRRIAWYIALAVGVLVALTTTLVYVAYLENRSPLVYAFGGWPPPIGIIYEVDGFNGLLALLIGWLVLAIVIYSGWYEREMDEPVWYYTLLEGLVIGMLGCLYTGDAFNLFVMLEVLSISAYGLVAYHKNRAEAVEAASKYSLIGAVATNMYFIALIIIYGNYSTLNMADLALVGRFYISSPLPALLAVSLSLWVFTYKAAVFPNHFWLPDAHPEAPTPVSAALSGLVVNIGVYAIMRFMYTIFGYNNVLGPYRSIVFIALLILGCVSALLGSLMMVVQNDLKRLLAYSTISHIGLVVMSGSLGFYISQQVLAVALAAMAAHIVSHSISKANLFMASGIFIHEAGSRSLDDLKGVGRTRPLTSIATALSLLNLAGFIPFIGFFSKLMMYQAFMEAGLPILGFIVILASAISLLGYIKILYSIVFSVGKRVKQKVVVEPVEYMLFAIAVGLLVLGVLFGLDPGLFSPASNSLLKEGVDNYIAAYLNARKALGGIYG
ncbi:proton-conducting transporter transmembrane domain-containing protein [Thermogladius sp. 4427co]|uniref:proton-conducting transporter transmembrane domain-containing protein n=1 Tax=Thermogladius sp. 4427co TaxID=3450718 RepID=UPI003F7A3214